MKRILILDDDDSIAELERDYLEIAGFEAVIIANGREGLQRGLEGGFDLVLLDVMGLLNLCPAVFYVILACFLRYHFFYILPMYCLCRLGRFSIRSTRR